MMKAESSGGLNKSNLGQVCTSMHALLPEPFQTLPTHRPQAKEWRCVSYVLWMKPRHACWWLMVLGWVLSGIRLNYISTTQIIFIDQ